MFHYLNARKLTLVRLIVPILLPNLICCYGRSICNDPFIITVFILCIPKWNIYQLSRSFWIRIMRNLKFFLYLNLRSILTLCVIIRLGVHFHYTCCILHNVQTVKIDGQIPTIGVAVKFNVLQHSILKEWLVHVNVLWTLKD